MQCEIASGRSINSSVWFERERLLVLVTRVGRLADLDALVSHLLGTSSAGVSPLLLTTNTKRSGGRGTFRFGAGPLHQRQEQRRNGNAPGIRADC